MPNFNPGESELERLIDSFDLTSNFSSYFDHTNLKEDASNEDIEKLCKEGLAYRTRTVCIRPEKVKYAAEVLKEYKDLMPLRYVPKVCVVIGYPEGNSSTKEKVREAKQALLEGAEELDMVLNRDLLKAKEYNLVQEDIEDVVAVAKKFRKDITVKVILETCCLTEDEIVKACEVAQATKADYVKTSTGVREGAKVEDVWLMYNTVAPYLKVKAAGGIHDAHTALVLIYFGADRIGATKTPDIIEEFKRKYVIK